jgi:hypothetical protein
MAQKAKGFRAGGIGRARLEVFGIIWRNFTGIWSLGGDDDAGLSDESNARL